MRMSASVDDMFIFNILNNFPESEISNLTLLHSSAGDESFFNVFKLKEGFRICVWLGPLFAFSMMMTISLINVITFCRTFAVVAPFYYKLYLR